VSVAKVTWTLEGAATEASAVRARVDIENLGFSLDLLIRLNLERPSHASHLIVMTFRTPPLDGGKVVRDIGVLQFKNHESQKGVPVAALQVAVSKNAFLVGLSSLPGDLERNTDLLLRRKWIDLPIRFASGQRAILSFEKGARGEEVVAEAHRQWSGPAPPPSSR
jgi:hypothetical protein